MIETFAPLLSLALIIAVATFLVALRWPAAKAMPLAYLTAVAVAVALLFWKLSVLQVFAASLKFSNAQGVRAQPRSLLQAIPGVELCEIADAHLCYGSAGTYKIDQPEVANALGREKVANILSTEADLVGSGIIGCMTELKTHLAQCNSSISVSHTMQVLRDAYRENDS